MRKHVYNLVLDFMGTAFFIIATYGCIGVAVTSKGEITDPERAAIAVLGLVFAGGLVYMLKEITREFGKIRSWMNK